MCGMAITLTRIELFCSQIPSQDSGVRRSSTCTEVFCLVAKLKHREVESCHGTSQAMPEDGNLFTFSVNEDDAVLKMEAWWLDRMDHRSYPRNINVLVWWSIEILLVALATAPQYGRTSQGYRPLVPPGFKQVTCQVRMPTWWKMIVWHLAGHTFILCKLA